jgi:hypothetical protein
MGISLKKPVFGAKGTFLSIRELCITSEKWFASGE